MTVFADRIKTVRKFTWFELTNTKYVRLKIKPDSSVRNWRTEDLLKTIAEQFRLPIDRLVREGFKVTGYQVQERASFEMAFEEGKVRFYLTIPEHIEPLIVRRVQSIWDKATVDRVEPAKPFDKSLSTIYEMGYRKHDMYSLRTDAKDNLPLSSLLEAGRLVGENERASVFTYFDPIYQMSWHYQLNEAWEKLRSGRVPVRFSASKRALLRSAMAGFSGLLQEVVGGLSELFSDGKQNNAYHSKPVDPEASKFAIDRLSESTKQKVAKQGLKTYSWMIVESENASRADIIARTMALSFNDLAGDNELQGTKVNSQKKRDEILRTVETHKAPRIKLKYNLMSSAEASKFCQIPGLDLQEKYREIERVEQAEIEVTDKNFMKDSGILLGEVTFKGQKVTVYQPTHDEDELCLPHVGVGGMGQGKTKGLLSNYALESVLKGYSSCAIDAAKGEIGDQIQHAVDTGHLKPEQFKRYDLGKSPFSLDFCEALHDERARARLANIVVHFFDVAEETTGQTERFLRASVLAMSTGRIAEIIRILNMNKADKEQEKHLDAAVKCLKDRGDEFNMKTLVEFQSYDAGMRRKIMSPILNRMNDIMGDPFLMQCMESDQSLDFVNIMAERGVCSVFDVRAADLDKVAVNIIVSLLSLKIDLAMRMRAKVHGPESEFPYFVLIDEPHQYMKSTKVWEDAVVESRKWKVCYFWAFHYFEQLPAKLQKAVKNALPHYHIYPTSTETFKSLLSEIYPFTMEDTKKLKRWFSINIIRTGGENAVPFIAQMSAPPAKRLTKIKTEK